MEDKWYDSRESTGLNLGGGIMKVIPGGPADKAGKVVKPNWEAMKIASEVTNEDIQKALDAERIEKIISERT